MGWPGEELRYRDANSLPCSTGNRSAQPVHIATALLLPLPALQPPLVETRINCPLSLMQTFWSEGARLAAPARPAWPVSTCLRCGAGCHCSAPSWGQ